MNIALTIAGRELRASFLSPGGYIIIALFLFVTGGVFAMGTLATGEIASMRSVFGIGTWLLAFIAPAVTMRLVSEELRLGTLEMLMTCPVREAEVIIGKFLGAMGLLAVMLAPTLFMVLALEMHGRPDYGELMCGYLGLMLAGAAYMSSGVLASTLTSSQPVAFLVAFFFWLGLGVGTKVLPAHLSDHWAGIIFAIDPDIRLRDFTIGLIDTSNIVYFISISAVFLIASIISLQARRWR